MFRGKIVGKHLNGCSLPKSYFSLFSEACIYREITLKKKFRQTLTSQRQVEMPQTTRAARCKPTHSSLVRLSAMLDTSVDRRSPSIDQPRLQWASAPTRCRTESGLVHLSCTKFPRTSSFGGKLKQRSQAFQMPIEADLRLRDSPGTSPLHHVTDRNELSRTMSACFLSNR